MLSHKLEQYKSMKVRTIPSSGKRGNIVAFKSRFGQCERAHVSSRKAPTAAQLAAQMYFGSASFGWNDLPEDARDAWCAYAKKTRSHPRCGQSGPLTGQNLFTAINHNQARLGLPLFVYPPERPEFDANPVVALSITQEGKKVVLKLKLSGAFAGHILLFGARLFNAGRRYCDKFTYLGPVSAPVGGECDLTAPYVERYGIPWPGSRVILQTVQQVYGWRNIPRRVEAVFRGNHAPTAQSERRQAALIPA